MSEPRNVLREAVLKDDKLDWELDFVEKARGNRFYQRVLKEYVLSDVSQALGKVHDIAIEAAKKMAVGRDLIWVVPTDTTLVRFYLAKRGKVWRISEAPPQETPERFTKTDISVNHEYGYDAAFSQSYLEDVPFQVLERAIADAAQLLEEQLTTDVIALYEGISAGSLAGGAEINATTSGTLAWKDLVNGWTAVKKAGYAPTVAMIHPDQVDDLWNDDKFIHAFYFGEKADVTRGVLGETYLGFKLVETDLCTATKCHLVDTSKAAVLGLRRDLLTQPYEEKLNQGVICTMRYGIAKLRESAVARIVSC